MKVIISGTRTFKDYDLLKRSMKVLNDVDKITCVISGCATGADTLGEKWAAENNIPVMKFPAEWDKYGKSAGPIRNELMSREADAMIAFWDGKSRGTKHMIETARSKGISVSIIDYEQFKI
jgi:hypothetical protein